MSAFKFRAISIGGAAQAALRSKAPARVFAAFERSCYVESPAGIACIGGRGIGRGPLNVIVWNFVAPATGDMVSIDLDAALPWKPAVPLGRGRIEVEIPPSVQKPAQAFLAWIAGTGNPDDALIGLGPGLTPAGDDFVGGAMIALRASGKTGLADRVAAWALPLAWDRTNRISRAHLECAAQGEGHEALHDLLCSFDRKHLARLARIGHSSGMDAAAGALLALA